MPELVPDATSALSEAESLTQGGSFASAVDVLARVVKGEAVLFREVLYARFCCISNSENTTKHFTTLPLAM